MATYYSVIQYIPDPLADERINFGVVIYGDGEVRSQFLRDWRRVERFGDGDISFLKDFASRVRRGTERNIDMGFDFEHGPLSEKILEEITGSWINSIQFSTPRASLDSPGNLLPVVAKRFLKQPTRHRIKRARSKRHAVQLATSRVELALTGKFGEVGKQLIRQHVMIQGKFDDHNLDIGIVNGKVMMGAYGLSFEGKYTAHESKLIDSVAWSIDDIRKINKSIPLSVVALTARRTGKNYQRAKHIFDGLGAQVIAEQALEQWADSVANKITKIWKPREVQTSIK